MNDKKMKRSFVLLGLTYALQANSSRADDSATPLVRFERVDQLSVEDLWDLASPTVISSKINALICYWPFDYDAVSETDGWRLIGVIGAGWSDLGETPIVAKVYARSDVYLLEEESKSLTMNEGSDSAVAVFGMSPRLCRDGPREGCGERISFSINENYVVSGDGVELGVVE